MKKKLVLVAAGVMVLALLVSCGKNPDRTEDPTQPEASAGAVADSIFEGDTPEDTPQPTVPTEGQSDPTKPADGQSDPTKPTGGDTAPTQPAPTTPGSTDPVDADSVDYAQFQAMTAAQQQAFAEAFETPEAFFTWLNEKKAIYEKENPTVEIDGSGTVNMEDLLK